MPTNNPVKSMIPVPFNKEKVEQSTLRIKSQNLLQHLREIEIDHEGKIYRLRLTQHNKLILAT
jgi:hemin uptake protein HemP